jgi:hypothetical protein
MEQLDLFTDGMEKTGLLQIVFENLMIGGLIACGAVLISPYRIDSWPIISVFYLGFAAVMLGFVLRKHLCSSCFYYGKNCHCGWGRLSALMFKQNSGNYKLGGTLGNFTWMVLMLFPLVVFGTGALTGKIDIGSWWPLLVADLLLLAINGGLHKKSCTACKMRYICPGSAAKKHL